MIDKIRPADCRDDTHSEDFLNGVFELDPTENLAGLDVDGPDSAGALLFSFCDRDATKDGRFADW